MLKRTSFLVLLCFLGLTVFSQNVTVTGALVGNGSYATLGAAFTAINGGAQTGATISIAIVNNTTETATAQLSAGTWTSLSIQPSGGAWTISANLSGAATIEFAGADNVTIDGLNSGGNALTILNSSTGGSGTSTIRMVNDASNNVLTRLNLQGSGVMAVGTNGGVVFLSTAASGGAGNDNNTISFCNIGPVGTALPSKGIYSNGTQTAPANFNSGNQVLNCNIFDVFGAANSSAGIYLSAGSSDWTINGNRFYQTATRTQTTGSVHANIQTAGTNASAGHTISGNIIGYANSAGTGTYSVVGNSSSSRYYPINIAGITAGNPTTVTNNVITNISFSGNISGTTTTAPFSGIHFNNTSGMMGTISGNLIGSMVADSSILITSSSTSTGEYYGIFYWPGASQNVIGNQIGGFTVTGSSSVVVGGIRMNTGSAASNTIQNNVIGSLAAPFIINSIGTSTRAYGILSEAGTPTVTGNSIGFFGHPGGSTSTSVGSYPLAGIICDNTTATGNTTIAGNTILSIASLNPTVAAVAGGIVYNGQTTGNNIISNNNIGNISLQTTNAAALLNGILVAGGNTTIVNNMVRLGHDATGASLVNGYQINGIAETGGSNNYYHNSVYVGGTGVGGSANTFAFTSTVTTNTRNIINNIFFNARSNGAGTGKHYGIRVGGTAPAPAGLNSNFNDIFVNGTGGFIGLFNTVDQPTLAAWRTATGVDVNSISGNPSYLNPTGNSLLGDLHIGPAPSVIEAAGTPLPSVTTDIDNQVRASFSPVDLGADAGNFLVQDISGPSITYTSLLYTCATGDRTFIATITDGIGVPTSGGLVPRVYFRKNAGAWFSTPGTLAGGTGQNGTWNFTISAAAMGGIVAGDAIQYYVIAQDNAAPINISSNPAAGLVATDVNTVTTPPTTPGTYTVNTALSGTYTVGTTGAFATLTAAVNAYNVSCLTGPVTFSLIDATYPTETFPINILANPDASAVNTLTIKPAAGVTPLISGSSAVAILRLTGADYVTIDGSNTVAGTTRDLTIANTNAGTTSLVIWVGTPAASNTVINPVIKNCNVRGNAPNTTGAGIMLSSGVTAGSIAEADIPNAQIVNNAITASYYGVGMFGGAAFQTNALVSGNVIGSATAAEKIGFSGITAAQQQNHTISGNTVFGVTFGGILSPNCSGIALTGTQSGGNVVRNTIYDVKNTNTTGYGAYGILLNSGSTGINMTIANNFISDVASSGWNLTSINDNGLGICVNNGTGYRIWHNTVLMNTNQTNTGSVTTALYVSSGVPAAAIDLRDNILVNTQTVGTNRYAIQLNGTSNNVFSNINYNDYFTTGPNLSTVNSTNQATLAALQTALGGNANSVNIAPVFAGAPDLHLPAASNPLLDNLGSPVGVTTDIDLQPRSNLRPDLGADEFGAVGPEIAVAGNNTLIVDGDVTPSPADFTDFGSVQACSGTLTRTFTIANTGNDTLRISSVVVTGTGFTLTTAPAILNLPPFAITTFVVTFDPAATGLSSGTVTVNSNDADEALYDFAIQGTGDADVTAPVAVCQNLTVQLNAAGSATIVAASVNNGSTDFCGITSLSVSPSTFSCANLGANNVTLTATDAAGNAGTCTATVTVADTIRPIAVCQSATIYLDAAVSATLAASQVNGGSSDNCGSPNLSVNLSTFTCANLGANTVNLTASDAASNTATCTATVTVVDSIDPVASCMAATIALDAAGTATLTTAMINNGSSDNCGAPVLSLSHTNFTCAITGPNTVTLTAMDASGNIGTCTATVLVTDTTAPSAVCQNISVVLDGAGMASIIPNDLNNGSSDNCGGALTFMASATSFTCANVGANTVTLTVTDPSANSATCTAIVTVSDTVDPVASCQAATVFLDAAGNATLAASVIDNGSSDNCGSVTLSASPATFTCADLGANSVALTVTDGSGNSSTCSAVVTVADTIAPNASCQPSVTVTLNASGNSTLSAAAVDNGSTDNCSIASRTLSTTAFTCANLGSGNTVTLTVTDGSGNTSTCNSIVTVVDTTDPMAVCQNLTVNLNAAGTATVTAASINSGSTDNCSIASLSVAPSTFTCANVGLNTVTLTVTDNSGNSSTCTATVTVIDNTAPMANCFNLINLNLDAAGNASLSPSSLDSSSTDNCGTVTLSASPTSFTCADVGSNISTLTVTDAIGNSSTCQTIVLVADVTAPTAACHDTSATLGGGGTATITPAMIDNGSFDACGIDTIFISQDVFACADVGPNTVTLTVTDIYGRSSTCTAIVTINANDVVPPVAICQDISLVLGAGGTVTINATSLDNGSTDNCGIAGFAATPTTLTCANIGTTSVILTVTDGGGNTDTCTSIVTLADPTAPVAVCQNVTVNLDAAGNGSTTAAAVNNGSSDNCGIVSLSLSQTSFTCANLGANPVTLTVTDASGNTATCTASVNVVDAIAPSAVCQNVSLSLNAAGTASTTAAAVNNGSTDNCSIASTTLSQSSFTCANLGSNTVTLTVTDGSGNSSTCTAVVTVTDTIAPTAICRNANVNLDAAGNATVTATAVNNGSADNCAITTLSVSPNSFTCANIGTNSVTLTVTDASGNSSTCTASVTVSDSLAPIAICQNVTVSLDAAGSATATAAAVNNGSTDNCAVTTLSLSQTSFTCANLGTNTVTLTATDASGNAGTCTAVVTVTDAIAPPAICQNISVSLDAAGTATASAAAVNSGSTDNCAIASLSLSQTTFTCANLGTSTVTLTATDASGNSGTCTAVVTVTDAIAPTAVCQNITVSLDAAGNATATAAAVNNGSTDNCAVTTLSLSPTSFTCANLGANTVTLTATDASGNASTCTAVVTVTDAIAPTAVCQNITVSLDAAGNATTTAASVNNGSTDNCAIATLSLSQTSFTCATLGANTVTLTATDASGNSGTCTATVTVTDAIAPTAVCQNITVSLDAAGTASATAAAVNNGSTDNCAVATLSLSQTGFTCANLGANTVTLTATDASGNSGTCTAVVTVTDTIAPTAVCQNITVSLDAAGTASATAAAVNNGSTDNCAITTLSLSQTSFTCANLGANTVTLTATDASGNSGTCTAVVTVTDAIAPNAICQNITVSLDAAGNATTTAAAVNSGSTDNCAVATLSLSQTSFTCANLGTNTVTLTVTDASGNSGTCTAVVTVTDAIAPTAVCQNITVSLDAAGIATATAAAVNNGSTDNCAVTTLSLSQTSFTCANLGANTVTLTATDASGNSGTCTAVVTVTDLIAPTAVCQNITVSLDAAGNATTTAAAVDNGSTDNCAVTTLSLSQTSFTCVNLGANTVTLTATDASGNSGTCTAVVTVTDAIAPTAVCQNITVSLDVAGTATATAAAVDNGSTDNCAVVSLALSQTGFTCANLGANSVTLTATDASGNAGTCTAVVTVVDAIAPTVVCNDTTIVLNPSGSTTLPISAMVASSSDNCGIDTVTASQDTWSCGPAGVTAVTITVTDASGNSSTCIANVTTTTTPLAGTLAPSTFNCGNNVSCNGATDGSITTTVAGGCEPYAFVWSTGASSQDLTGIGAGTYTVTITDAGGNTDIQTITLLEPAALAAQVVAIDSVCAGDNDGSIDVDVTGGNDCLAYSYLWSTGDTTQDLTGLSAGTYTLTVTDASGCTTTITVTVGTHPAPVPVITETGGVLTCAPAFPSYQWNLAGIAIRGATGASYTPTITGTYTVTVIDSNGCAGTSDTLLVTGVKAGFDRLLGVQLYPNPARGEFKLNVDAPISLGLHVTVTDMYGKQVKRTSLAQLTQETAFDIQDLAQGSYLVEVLTLEGQRAVFRLVVQ